MQVILGVFAVFPPSRWFSPGDPLPSLGVFGTVLLASAGAAQVHGTIWATVVAWLCPSRGHGGKLRGIAAVSMTASSVYKRL